MQAIIDVIKALLEKMFPSNTEEGPIIEPDDPLDDDESKDPIYTPSIDQDKFKK